MVRTNLHSSIFYKIIPERCNVLMALHMYKYRFESITDLKENTFVIILIITMHETNNFCGMWSYIL